MKQDANTFSFSADTEHLASLGAFLHQTCRNYAQITLIELAVTEVVVNAIRHGGARTCSVQVKNTGSHYLVTVVDDGHPFNPLDFKPLPLGQLRESGYGLSIVKRTAGKLHYLRHHDQNHLEMEFPHSQGAS
jgi:anti-sigma regulatory factor (Ser/Thr protein kinase)